MNIFEEGDRKNIEHNVIIKKKKKGSFAFQIPAGESIDNMIQPFMGVFHTKKFA